MKISVNALFNYCKIRFLIQNIILRKLKKNEGKLCDKKISIAISTNNTFINQTLIMISSLENIKCNINLYILNINLYDKDISKIRKVAPSNVNIREIKIDRKRLNELKISEKWPIEAWARILIPELIPENEVLYLDVDCLIVNDICNMISNNKDNYISGIKSTYYLNNNEYKNLKNAVNSGVLLMNVKKLITFNFANKILDYAKENKANLVMPDQDSINVVCKDVINNIDPKYNCMNYFFSKSYNDILRETKGSFYSKNKYNECLFDPYIIHFNGGPFARPWIKSGIKHPYYKLYKYYENKVSNILN